MTSTGVRTGTAAGRWVIAAAVLGSGVSFLDSTVVNAALPAIARDLHTDLGGLQWVVTAYLLTLGSLLVLGGALGDRFGRRRLFVVGLLGFAVTSVLCGLAPGTPWLIGARALQGAAAALAVPNSLALVSASFAPEDRGRAIGAWSGLGGVATAIGPFLGGWLIDAVSWRLVFLVNLPVVAVAVTIALRHVPESFDEHAREGELDARGSVALTVGLAGIVYALIEGPGRGTSVLVIAAAVIGFVAVALFVVCERRAARPIVPLDLFRSRQFSGANAVTFAVYAALGAVTFLLVVHLQTDLGYSALEAGASLIPMTVLMLVGSPRAGALAQRIGPRLPMTVGPLVGALGMLLLAQVEPGSTYWTAVFPGVFVLGIGLTLTVAPLTATVLGAVEDEHAGIASAVNNAVARIAGLLAVAVLPAAVGLTATHGLDLTDGFAAAMRLAAAIAAVGGILAAFTIRRALVSVPVADPVAVPVAEPAEGAGAALPCGDQDARSMATEDGETGGDA
jgi:EmrB/QacA subfamily drug resistance transporter